MRDIKAGRDINVEGDIIVNDQSQEYKLLIHCTNSELLAEKQHRQGILAEERSAKFNRFMSGLGVAATLLFVAGAWYWFQGSTDIFSFLTGGSGFILGLASLKVYEKPTLFEQRQLAALQEIHMLLRERGVSRS